MPEIDTDRPIYNALPLVFSKFHTRDTADKVTDSAILVAYWETIYMQWEQTLNSILEFNGDYSVFNSEQLDTLAAFFGFSDSWYNVGWTNEQKVCLFKGVYQPPYIWKHRGSIAVFNHVVNCLGIPATIAALSGFIAGINKAGDICGSAANGQLGLTVPASYMSEPRSAYELPYLIQHWIPAHIKITIAPNANIEESL